MASRRCQHEAISPRSLELIQDIPLQDPFNLDDFPMEFFHYEDVCTHFYASFHDHCIEVERSINLCVS